MFPRLYCVEPGYLPEIHPVVSNLMKIVLRRAQGRGRKLKLLGFWRFFSIRYGNHKHQNAMFVEIHLARFFTTLALLFVMAYLAIVSALTVFWGNRPHSPITFWDVFIPTNWSDIRPKQGQMLIAQADESLQLGEGRDAFFLYRAGLRMYPQDTEARLKLALMFASANMYTQAASLLEEGLEYGVPENDQYLKTLFQVIQIEDNHPATTRVVPRLIASGYLDDKPRLRYSLIRQWMLAQLLTEDYIGLLDNAERINADPEAPYKAHDMVVASLSRSGAEDDALEYIESLPESSRQEPAIMVLEASVLHQLERDGEMMALLQKLFRYFPNAFPMQINAIVLMLDSGLNRQADAYIDLFLANHKRNARALNALATRLTDYPDSARLWQLVEFCREHLPRLVPTMDFYYAQALVTEGKFEEASDFLDESNLLDLSSSEDEGHIEVFDLIVSSVTDAGQKTRAELVEALRSKKWEAEIYWEAARALYLNDDARTALDVMNIAQKYYPYHPSLSALRDNITEGKPLKERGRNQLTEDQVLQDDLGPGALSPGFDYEQSGELNRQDDV